MSSSKSIYPYQTLDQEGHQIRLLTLHCVVPTAICGGHLTCSLRHVALDDKPSYAALSYVWGDPTQTESVTLGGHTVQITRNLYTAMQRLSDPKEDITLWIDALCINQSDSTEKNTQVPLMSRIYGQADRVLIWLGPESEGSTDSAALHMMRDLGIFFRELKNSPGFDNAKIVAFVKTVLQFAIAEEGTPRFDFDAIYRLFNDRPWWGRVWIIQEVILAQKASVLLGDHAVDWEDVREGLQVFEWMILYPSTETIHQRIYQVLKEIYLNVVHLNVSYTGYKRTLENDGNVADRRASTFGGMSLLETLLLTSNATGRGIQATDNRDRIYGLLGIMSAQDRNKIAVDYSSETTLSNILFTVGKALLEEHGPDIFSYCRDTDLSSSLPSWIPDWTAPRIPFIGEVSLGQSDHYNASKGTSWKPRALEATTYDHPRILIQGVLLSEVKVVGIEFTSQPSAATHQSYIADCQAWLSDLMSLSVQGNNIKSKNPKLGYNSSHDLQLNLWQIPVHDMGLVGRTREQEVSGLKHGFNVLTGATRPPPGMDEVAKTGWMTSESWNFRRVWKIYKRRAFVDQAGHLGIGPENVTMGDRVAIFAGGHVPFILRQAQPSRYRLIGAAYIQNFMDGEAVGPDVVFREICISN